MAQGHILRTVKQVLAAHPDGLQVVGVNRLVEQWLDRQLPPSMVRNALKRNPAFERISYGRYRLREASG